MKKNDTQYAKSPLCDLFGSTPTSIMLTFFIANNINDFNISEISFATHLSRPTITKVLKPLLRFGFVVESRRLGHTKLYRLGLFRIHGLNSIKECISCDKVDCPAKQALLELVKLYE